MWLGIALTGFFLWLALRDVDGREFGRAIARANWLVLFGVSVPCYVVLVWVRALRWRHLTDSVQPMPAPALFRATAVGFMVNNVFPLRVGEVARAWYLSRETGGSAAAIFGTVILERVIDTISVLLMVLLVLTFWGAGEGQLERGALLLVPVALLPIGGLVFLRLAPERVLALAGFLTRPLPARVSVFVDDLLRRFTEGLGAMSRGRHLLWVALYSLVIWLVFSALPIVATFVALHMDLGPPFQVLGAAWTTQAAVGVAVALPSAPGFFGIFHWACKLALLRFGVDPATAVAAGTLVHAVMWLTLTGMGLLAIRFGGPGFSAIGWGAAREAAPDR